jgi:hypothetical protein
MSTLRPDRRQWIRIDIDAKLAHRSPRQAERSRLALRRENSLSLIQRRLAWAGLESLLVLRDIWNRCENSEEKRGSQNSDMLKGIRSVTW